MPRSLARTAVHPPHRIGQTRTRTPMKVFMCVMVSFVVAVVSGISYFSIDIWLGQEGVSSDSSRNKPNTHTQSFPLAPNALNPPVAALGSIQSVGVAGVNKLRQGLEKLVMPDREHIISEVVTSRLVDIPQPAESQVHDSAGSDAAGKSPDAPEDSVKQGGDDESNSLDEPFDEDAASHLMREDIDPTHNECKVRQEQILANDLWETDLSMQKSALASLEDAQDTEEYNDWWDYPKQYHTKLDNGKYCNTIHKASHELHNTRAEWFEKQKKDGKVKGLNSNKFDEEGCVVYKMDDDYVKWHPPHEMLCNWKNSAIFWHTMHGTKIGWDFRKAKSGEHWVWDLATELNDERQGRKCECPDNVAFIFADNQVKEDGFRLIERSYKFCNKNCHFFHVAKTYEPWDWFGKIGPVLDLINNETFQKQFEYAVLTDADDQSLVQSPINIVEKFQIYEADMVIGGEDTSYPHWMRLEKAHENRASPWSKHHQHLNAGGFMGNIKAMIPYLEYMKEDYKNFTKQHEEEIAAGEKNRWRDQTCLREMYRKFYPKIKIDSLALLWSRVDIYMYDL